MKEFTNWNKKERFRLCKFSKTTPNNPKLIGLDKQNFRQPNEFFDTIIENTVFIYSFVLLRRFFVTIKNWTHTQRDKNATIAYVGRASCRPHIQSHFQAIKLKIYFSSRILKRIRELNTKRERERGPTAEQMKEERPREKSNKNWKVKIREREKNYDDIC